MFEPMSQDSGDSKLGSLTAYVKRSEAGGAILLTPVWSIHNFQGLTWSFAQAALGSDREFEVGKPLF